MADNKPTAPQQTKPQNEPPADIVNAAPAKKPNRFLAYFPLDRVVFRNNIMDPGKPWQNGTVSQTLADCVLALGDTGAHIPAARIVKLTTQGNGVRLDLQMPSSGGAFKRSMLDVSEDETAKREWIEYRALVCERYKAWRRELVKAGAAAIKGAPTATGVGMNAEDLTELGIE
jgi:hypothetical protein